MLKRTPWTYAMELHGDWKADSQLLATAPMGGTPKQPRFHPKLVVYFCFSIGLLANKLKHRRSGFSCVLFNYSPFTHQGMT